MLTAEQFCQHVNQLQHGKQLPEAIYLHCATLEKYDETLSQFVQAVAKALKISPDQWNIVKLGRQAFRLSLLHYPDFFSFPYPSLQTSITVDLSKLRHRIIDYREQENPPILHRKEQMIFPDHPSYVDF